MVMTVRLRAYCRSWYRLLEPRGGSVTLTQQFYEQVDHQVMGWNTVEDAVAIAQLIIAESNGDVADLHKKTAWSKRRFNPALAHLLPLFPEGRISQVIQDDYHTDWLAVEPEDRAALRRFVARFKQNADSAQQASPAAR